MAGREKMKHRVFVADDSMGLLTKMMCEQCGKRDFLCAETIEDASIIVVGDEGSFNTLRAQNKYAQIVTSEWLEAFDADDSKPEPSAHSCNANPAKFLRNVVVQLLVSHHSCRWGSVYSALIAHMGGRIAGLGEKATVAVFVEDGNSEISLGSRGEVQDNIPVVSSLWLEESFRSKQRLPFDSYTVCAEKENTRHRLASSSALAPLAIDPTPPTYEAPPEESLSIGIVDISPRLLGKKRELLRSISEELLSSQSKSFTHRLAVRDFATEAEFQELRSKYDFVVGEWYLICSHIAHRFLPIPAERFLSTTQARLQSLVFRPPRHPDGIAGFESFVFSCTSFSSTVRHNIARAVSVAGSLFLSDLASCVTTHLVVSSSEESSQKSVKHEKATSCPSIKIVTLDWLVKCLTVWKHIDEEQFNATPSSQASGGGFGASQHEDFYDATQGSVSATQSRASHSSQRKATPSLISPSSQLKQQQLQQQQQEEEEEEEEMQVAGQEEEDQKEKENEAKEEVEMCEGTSKEPPTPMGADCEVQETKKVFLLSCGDSERAQLTRSIEKLGGEVIGLPGATIFEPDCSHFLTSNGGIEMKRTEKLLCAFACGKVVLKHHYLEECVNAGRWLDEADFLYVGQQYFPAQIGAKWGNQPPFIGMRALIFDSKASIPPSDVLVRVISSGGGQAVLASEDAAQELICPDPTIFFVRAEDLKDVGKIAGGAPKCVYVDPRWVVDFLSLPDVGTFSSSEYIVSASKPEPKPEPEPAPEPKAKAPTKKRKSRR